MPPKARLANGGGTSSKSCGQCNARCSSARYHCVEWVGSSCLYRLPSDDSRARVAVWRELRRSGALHLQQSVVAVPDDAAFAGVVERLRDVLSEVGGQVTALRAEPAAGDDDRRLLEAWNAARDAEYRELAGECAKFLAEIDHEFEIEKFTLAELDEEEVRAREASALARAHPARVTSTVRPRPRRPGAPCARPKKRWRATAQPCSSAHSPDPSERFVDHASMTFRPRHARSRRRRQRRAARSAGHRTRRRRKPPLD